MYIIYTNNHYYFIVVTLINVRENFIQIVKKMLFMTLLKVVSKVDVIQGDHCRGYRTTAAGSCSGRQELDSTPNKA